MSKHETWRTRKFWEENGGLLIEEFIAVKPNKNQGIRVIDAVIVLDEPKRIHDNNEYDISGKDVIVVQTKSGRLGMYLLGQSFFSRFLIERHNPSSIRNVAICGKSDVVMEELARVHNIEVVVIPDK